MKELGKIIFYLIASVLLGTLLAPPLYWGGQWLAGHGVLPWLAGTPFRKFFNRGILVAAVVLIWPVVRWLRVPGVRGLGLNPNPRFGRDLATGFALSCLTMAALGAVLVALHVAGLRGHIPWNGLGKVAISAVVVAFLEEWLFRGAILGLLQRALSARVALLGTSVLFSVVHFLKLRGPAPSLGTIHWFSGFTLLPEAFSQFREPWLVLGGFTTLFLVGWILGYSRLRTRSLAMPFGLHAGWIVGKLGFSKMTWRMNRNLLPWFGDDLSVGLGSVAVVLLTGALVWAYLRRRTAGD